MGPKGWRKRNEEAQFPLERALRLVKTTDYSPALAVHTDA